MATEDAIFDIIPLPLIRFGNSLRYDKTEEELFRLSVYCLPNRHDGVPPLPMYFFAADDQWYEAVNIRDVKPLPLLDRIIYFGPNVRIAKFQFRRMSHPPMSVQALYRELREHADMYAISLKTNKAECRRALRACKSCVDLVAWLEKYTEPKKYNGY
ncbi:MAG: hypothetical protein SFX74_04790 [Fimbriimonadaceae bacterium]|nr:hypothetical protein [Fimbriimonadaceae bacterium]